MIIPCLVSIGYLVWKHNDGYEWTDLLRDAGVQLAAAAIIAATGLGIAYWQGTTDTEIWNGQVTSKKRQEVSCRHSYQCNCRTETSGSGKNQTSYTVCDTCYEHSYDIDWDVFASTGEALNIDTVDRQGLVMPPRWGKVFVGEPFSSQHSFTNYIKANPKSVLLGQKGDMKKFGSLIPGYPVVYDYYHVRHIFNEDVPLPPGELFQWDWLLGEANKTLGTQKQVNLLVILVHTDDPAYMYAFRDAWLGGKKNDAIVLIGSKDGHEINWADVVSWTPNKEYNIYVRDRIMEEKYLDHKNAIVNIIAQETNTRFVRLHMKDMKWLMRGFQPSSTAMTWIALLGVLASIGGCFFSNYMHEEYC